MIYKILLVGNPNAGKSTLFNLLAKADEHVGNWHGVTTEFKEKSFFYKSQNVTLTDLPGVYSLSPYSFEEEVTKNYLFSHKDCTIINIVDGNNLKRNLLLTLELLEAGFKPILAINMKRELNKNNVQIDLKKLEKELNVKCFLIDATDQKDGKEILDYIINKKDNNDTKSQIITSYFYKIERFFDEQNFFLKQELSIYDKTKIMELDNEKISLIFGSTKCNKIMKNLENNSTLDKVFKMRFNIIGDILNKCVSSKKTKVYGYSKFDKFVLNRWLCFPIFFVIISLIFWLTFGTFGSSLSNGLSFFINKILLSKIIDFVENNVANQFVLHFVEDAICGSISSIFSFLPQVVLMFLGLFVLEGTGYMSRIAFSFEDFLKKFGLSGKSIFAILMSFGCSTTATLSARNLENKNGKIKTAMLTPYLSCTAKLPIYSVICSAFFPDSKFLIVIILYLLSVGVALLLSYIFNKTFLKSDYVNFVMELPKYRFPDIKKITKNLWTNVKQFSIRAGSVLITFSCIIWVLQNCNFKFEYGNGQSMLESISKWFAPIFSPLGFGNSGAVSVLICGFIAKEILVSTIGIINGLDGSNTLVDISNSLLVSTSIFCLTKSSSISFLVFSLLYLPCLSTISVMVKEIGKKWTLIACIVQFCVSYMISFVTYRVANYFVCYGILNGLVSLFVFLALCFAFVYFFKIFKNKRHCNGCPNKKVCNKNF